MKSKLLLVSQFNIFYSFLYSNLFLEPWEPFASSDQIYFPGQIFLACCYFLNFRYIPAVVIDSYLVGPRFTRGYSVVAIGEAWHVTEGRIWTVTAQSLQSFTVDIPMSSTTD